MDVSPADIARRIEERIPGAAARVEGADAHFSAVVVADAFAGKTRVEQHRMVYALFRDEMANQTIHALALRTATPAEWDAERPGDTRDP
jgi:acid stress-induced BolA-like protein IbaG/YrbA